MAAKIFAMQRSAIAAGETLILYEAFRPADVQKKVGNTLTALHGSNATVRAGIDGGGWGIGSFIALTMSNHQRGVAIDVSLGKITGTEDKEGLDYSYTELTAEEYVMPTPVHELSKAAASFAYPVTTNSGTAWQKAPPGPNMTDDAMRMRSYATAAGLRPLSSEWWHFDDWDARKTIAPGVNGAFRLVLPTN
jgi:D-alanyl-D-alanine dipeptidase